MCNDDKRRKSEFYSKGCCNRCIKGKFDSCLKSAMEMAEWKDSQYKSKMSKLEKQINLLKVSLLLQEYRRGFNNAMKQSTRNEQVIK